MRNATQENCTDPKENKPVNSGNIQEENSLYDIRKLRLRNVNTVVIGNININFFLANFDQVKEVILKIPHIKSYLTPSQNDQYHFEALDKALDCYSSNDRIVLIGGCNSEDHKTYMETFLYQHNLENIVENIVKKGTCFKNSSKPSTIDLFLTNNSSYFQTTKTI